MKTLSVVLATYNEEANIYRCIDSVKNLADEVIVVDGGSEDRTVEIAKKNGAQVVVTENPRMFHINKQKAIDMAKKDWILQLDADEQVSEELKEEIVEKLRDNNDKYSGYWIPRKNWFLGRFLMKGGQYPDFTLRLYQRGKGYLPQKDVHEQAIVKGKVGYLDSPLLHYPYRNFANYLEKWKRYVDIIAEQTQYRLNKENQLVKLIYGIEQIIVAPIYWFFLSYFRHRGFVDSWQGFIFCFFSALRYPASYIIYLQGNEKKVFN